MLNWKAVKVTASYFILYVIIASLAAWVPFMLFGIIFGGISIILAAMTMAVLRAIDFINDQKKKIGIKKFLIAMILLLCIDVVWFFLYGLWA
ncbi:hypothetical protein [Fangia hongkongensis]|uniref:hypothetical protein n=1 Tax=Fangia hongkongensis TaxID=270495 RepID=UPI000377DEA3|nr:hypothetical protein [Fangia hongkongensis]MBK2123884.1 hypothetical protein [Fangia hongkongensis]